MTKKTSDSNKKSGYVASQTYLNSLKTLCPPYLTEEDVKLIENKTFDYEKNLEPKQFKYLLNNAYSKKV